MDDDLQHQQPASGGERFEATGFEDEAAEGDEYEEGAAGGKRKRHATEPAEAAAGAAGLDKQPRSRGRPKGKANGPKSLDSLMQLLVGQPKSTVKAASKLVRLTTPEQLQHWEEQQQRLHEFNRLLAGYRAEADKKLADTHKELARLGIRMGEEGGEQLVAAPAAAADGAPAAVAYAQAAPYRPQAAAAMAAQPRPPLPPHMVVAAQTQAAFAQHMYAMQHGGMAPGFMGGAQSPAVAAAAAAAAAAGAAAAAAARGQPPHPPPPHPPMLFHPHHHPGQFNHLPPGAYFGPGGMPGYPPPPGGGPMMLLPGPPAPAASTAAYNAMAAAAAQAAPAAAAPAADGGEDGSGRVDTASAVAALERVADAGVVPEQAAAAAAAAATATEAEGGQQQG